MISNGFFNFIVLVVFSFGPDLWGQTEELKKSVQNKTIVTENSTDILCVCKRAQSTRWLRAYKLDDGKCNTVYSKEGYLQVVGSGSYFSSCEAVLFNVKKNLEEGGFVCDLAPKHSILMLE